MRTLFTMTKAHHIDIFSVWVANVITLVHVIVLANNFIVHWSWFDWQSNRYEALVSLIRYNLVKTTIEYQTRHSLSEYMKQKKHTRHVYVLVCIEWNERRLSILGHMFLYLRLQMIRNTDRRIAETINATSKNNSITCNRNGNNNHLKCLTI